MGLELVMPAPSTDVDGELMDLSVSTLAGASCMISISPSSSVADLKHLIHANLGFECACQQLICGMKVLQPNKALLKSFVGVAKVIEVPNITVIRVGYASTRSEHILMEDAQCPQVNGAYTRANTNCYVKDNDRSIRIFRYEADSSWPAAWYIERAGNRGIYYAVPDQTLGETDEDAQELGFPLPLSGWEPWSGAWSDPGQLPAPEAKVLD